jgi:phenylacetate-CoA ligase
MARSPYYRERYREAGLDPTKIRTRADLSRVPILEKTDLKREFENLLCDDVDRSTLTQSATGGTTGEPTRYFWDDAYWCASSAASFRAYSFAGFRAGDRHAMIWGTAFHQGRYARFRERLEQRARNLLVVPGFELSEESLPRWADAVRRHRPKLVEGYTSLLVLFASYLLREGIRDIRPEAVLSSAERLHSHQRELIEEAFGAPVFDRYGTREVGCIGAECEQHDGLHLSAEHVLVETVRGDEPCAAGETGDIVVTCLSNQVFPFIRYRIGDLGALIEGPCPCGRGLPRLRITEGRTHDLLTTDQDTYLPGEFFPHLFKDYVGVEMFQVHQHADRSVTIRIVRNDGWDVSQEASYKTEVAGALGATIPVTYEYVDSIERTRAGKLRFTVSDVPVDLTAGRAPARSS